MNTLFAFMLGTPELVILGVIVILLFGTRIPTVMRSLGQGVTEFKRGVKDADEEPAGESQK